MRTPENYLELIGYLTLYPYVKTVYPQTGITPLTVSHLCFDHASRSALYFRTDRATLSPLVVMPDKLVFFPDHAAVNLSLFPPALEPSNDGPYLRVYYLPDGPEIDPASFQPKNPS
jgi:hypothetical protein